MGVPGKLKLLLDRMTAARTANLDNLDVAVSSRAPGASALNTAIWTNARAGYLDNLSAGTVSTFVQSVQTGYINSVAPTGGAGEDSVYTDVGIAAVNPAKSVVLLQSLSYFNPSGYFLPTDGTARLVASNVLRVSSVNATPAGVAPTSLSGRWIVLEFK
jgi:hypothetical protein